MCFKTFILSKLQSSEAFKLLYPSPKKPEKNQGFSTGIEPVTFADKRPHLTTITYFIYDATEGQQMINTDSLFEHFIISFIRTIRGVDGV